MAHDCIIGGGNVVGDEVTGATPAASSDTPHLKLLCKDSANYKPPHIASVTPVTTGSYRLFTVDSLLRLFNTYWGVF